MLNLSAPNSIDCRKKVLCFKPTSAGAPPVIYNINPAPQAPQPEPVRPSRVVQQVAQAGDTPHPGISIIGGARAKDKVGASQGQSPDLMASLRMDLLSRDYHVRNPFLYRGLSGDSGLNTLHTATRSSSSLSF